MTPSRFVMPRLCLQHQPLVLLDGEVEDESSVDTVHLLDGDYALHLPCRCSELINDDLGVDLEWRQKPSHH